MDAKAIAIVAAVFICILVLPVVLTLRSTAKEETHEKPEQRKKRLRSTDEYKRLLDCELVNNMVMLIQSVPDVVTTLLTQDSFTVQRRIDRLGEIVPLSSRKELHFDAIGQDELELIALAAEERLRPDYIAVPRWTGKKKERRQEGYYISLDPSKTSKIIDERTEEAIYNGERTGDL